MNKMSPLLSQEVYETIVRHIDRYSDRNSLVSVARSTRALHEVASSILWERMDTAVPLLRLFPGEAVEFDMESSENFIFHRPLRREEWARFDHYAKWVLALWNGPNEFPWDAFLAEWNESLLLRCSIYGFSNELFPNLLTLHWTNKSPRGLTYVAYYFASSHLRELTLGFSDRYIGDLSGMVDCFQANSPPIRTLEIRRFGFSLIDIQSSVDKLAANICHLLSVLPTVSKIETDSSIVASMLRNPSEVPISHLQVIEVLEPGPSLTSDAHIFRAMGSESIFPNLRSLNVWRYADTAQVVVLLSSASHTVAKLRIVLRSLSSPDDMALVLSTIGTSFPRLKSLHVSLFPPSQAGEYSFGDLLGCTSLEELRLFTTGGPSLLISDEDVYRMSLSWPLLTSLRLDCEYGEGLPSLHSMYELLIRCPKLRSLELRMDIQEPYPPIPAGPVGTYRLDSLNLLSSPIYDPLSFAVWLCDICPASGFASRTNAEVKRILATLQSTARAGYEKWGRKVEDMNSEKNKLLQDNRDLQSSLRAARLENQILKNGRANIGRF